MLDFSIVIPVYNEADKITTSLTQIINFMRGFSDSFEILVVNDGSTDNSAELIKTYAKDTPEVRFINNTINQGKGYVVKQGFEMAEGKYILQTDADLSAPIAELKKLYLWVHDHDFDIVIGSREGVGARRIGEPWIRHLMGRIFNFFVQLFVLPGIQDTQCGFKLFKKEVVDRVFPKVVVYAQNQARGRPFMGAYDVEVLHIAKVLGYKIKEVPVEWVYVKTSRLSHVRDSIKMLRDVLKIRFNDMMGKYK